MNTKTQKNTNRLFVIIISLLCTALWFVPTGFENPELTNSKPNEEALVLSVDNKQVSHISLVSVGTQQLKVKLLSGSFEGDTITAINTLVGQIGLDKIFKKDDKVLVVLELGAKRTKIVHARAFDLFRLRYEYILFALFALFLLAFAGWTGFKALLSFVFTALVFWKILIPAFLNNLPPLLVAFGVVALTTSVIILLISGFCRKGYVALSGAIAGVAITTILSVIFGHFFRIPGTVQNFSASLLYAGFTYLNLSDIFLSCIFISAAGAVMDVAMDISAAQNELLDQNPYISTRQLIVSGFNIAYPVIGTMTTTLLFAYSGSFMFTFMVFMAKGTPLIQIFNLNFIVAEIFHTLVGSFGLVLVAPATAIIGGYIYSRRN